MNLHIFCHFYAFDAFAVLLSRLSKDGFARLDGRLGKIARLTPVFLQFCPSFCDLVHVQSVSELLSKVNYVATRLRHLETIRWHVEWKLPPNELSPKIVLIYALLLLKCRESNFRVFLIHNLNFARLFARLTPVFLLKKRPSFARLFTKMSPSEELVTLHMKMPDKVEKVNFVQIGPPLAPS